MHRPSSRAPSVVHRASCRPPCLARRPPCVVHCLTCTWRRARSRVCHTHCLMRCSSSVARESSAPAEPSRADVVRRARPAQLHGIIAAGVREPLARVLLLGWFVSLVPLHMSPVVWYAPRRSCRVVRLARSRCTSPGLLDACSPALQPFFGPYVLVACRPSYVVLGFSAPNTLASLVSHLAGRRYWRRCSSCSRFLFSWT